MVHRNCICENMDMSAEPFITAPALDAYLSSLLPPRDSVLAEMEKEAERRNIPIVGPVVAAFLSQLATMTGAKRIFELGSAIGYSTLWWARAAGETGEVFYTERDPALSREAAEYFDRAGVAGRIRLMPGDAIAAFQSTPGDFDLIFCDLDKPRYPEALRLAAPRLRPGGLFIADNVLWKGKVAGPDSDPQTAAMREITRQAYALPGFSVSVLPLRDGILLARKGR